MIKMLQVSNLSLKLKPSYCFPQELSLIYLNMYEWTIIIRQKFRENFKCCLFVSPLKESLNNWFKNVLQATPAWPEL